LEDLGIGSRIIQRDIGQAERMWMSVIWFRLW